MRASGLAAVLVAVPVSIVAMGRSRDDDRAARVSEVHDRVLADAGAASGCADELRAMADRSPALVASALELQDLPATAVPQDLPPAAVLGLWARPQATAEAAARSRHEIERRERLIAADLVQIGDGAPSDRAALDRAFRSGEQARQVREHLCQARDIATTLAAIVPDRLPPRPTARVRGEEADPW